MKVIYLDKFIQNRNLEKVFGVDYFSEIRIGNSSTFKIISNDIEYQNGFQKIAVEDLPCQDDNENCIVITSNIFYADKNSFKLFFKSLKNIVIDTFWGDTNNFIYKGKLSSLKKILNAEKHSAYVVELPSIFYKLNSLFSFKQLLAESHSTRFFNQIKKKGKIIIKKSSDKVKLKSEYDFLSNIPKKLSHHYAQVYSFNELKNHSQYEVKSYDMLDFSYQLINDMIDKTDVENFFSIVKSFLADSVIKKVDKKNTDFNDLLLKNEKRFNLLKQFDFFDDLNKFCETYADFSLNNHFQNLQSLINDKKKYIINSNQIFSHGDLCFSNILFDKEVLEIKLIDPRGYENKGLRTPYYDVAKLSHSALGYYDLIINDLCEIKMNNNMRCFLDFKKNISNIGFKLCLKNMANSLNLDYKTIRIVESSLFLSMLPLHKENLKKVYMLALRSKEILEEI
tara:strand:+ start:11195 stop:12550 length:1356 start_codon:yes stop_codon:yes gene_type:complete